MSRKHNTKHARARGRYLIRLGKRDLSKTPTMTDLDTLRQRADRLPEPEKRLRARVARIQLNRGLYYGPRPYPIDGTANIIEEVAA